MTTLRYAIGYPTARTLRRMADRVGASRGDYASIDRLEEFRGDERDVERVASLCEDADDPELAEILRSTVLVTAERERER